MESASLRVWSKALTVTGFEIERMSIPPSAVAVSGTLSDNPTQPITLQLDPELLAQVQAIAGSPENLHDFLLRATEHEVQRSQPFTQKHRFWENVEQLHTEMAAEGIEIEKCVKF